MKESSGIAEFATGTINYSQIIAGDVIARTKSQDETAMSAPPLLTAAASEHAR
jgi:hypothetical protein